MLSCSSAIYFSVKITYLLICHLPLAHFSDFLVLNLLTHGLPSSPPRAFEPVALGEFLVFTISWSLQMAWSGDHTLRTTILFPLSSHRSYSSLVKTVSMFTLLLLLLSFHVVTLLQHCSLCFSYFLRCSFSSFIEV